MARIGSGKAYIPIDPETVESLSRIGARLADDLGFIPTPDQIVRHLIVKAGYGEGPSK